MDKYFADGYSVKRHEEATGEWSDGNGAWDVIATITGHIRTLGATERTDTGELITTHRFYTYHKDIMYGDKLEFNGAEYKVKLVDEKKMGSLDFMQVDCEFVI